MWKIIRGMLLYGTALIFSVMHAGWEIDRLRREAADSRQVVALEEIEFTFVQGEIAAHHAAICDDIKEALTYVQTQKELRAGPGRHVFIQGGKSPVFNIALRFFALMHAVPVCGDVIIASGDMLRFPEICSIVTSNKGHNLSVLIDASCIDLLTPFGRLALQCHNSVEFLSTFIQMLSAWVDEEEAITYFELRIEGLPKIFPALPIVSKKLMALSLDSRHFSQESCAGMLLPNLERLKLHATPEDSPCLETLLPFCPRLKSVELF